MRDAIVLVGAGNCGHNSGVSRSPNRLMRGEIVGSGSFALRGMMNRTMPRSGVA